MKKIMVTIIEIFVFISTFGICKIKEWVEKKQYLKITEVAKIVENLYTGETALFKKEMFVEICKKAGLNLKIASSFLEKYLIPVTKSINYFSSNKKDGITECIA